MTVSTGRSCCRRADVPADVPADAPADRERMRAGQADIAFVNDDWSFNDVRAGAAR